MRCLSVIVHHRGNRILVRCIESLLAEASAGDQIVVFANGLEEELPPICENEHVLMVESAVGLGFSEANNRAVEQARKELGEFDCYLFINNDARLFPDALSLLKTHFQKHPQCAIVGPRLVIDAAPDHLNSLGLNVTRQGEAWDEGIGIHQDEYGELPKTKEVLAVTGAALLMRSSTFEQLDGWNSVFGYYFEDIDLCIRAWRSKFTVMIEPNAVAGHAISASTAPVSEFKTFHSWRNQFVLLLLHWPALLLAIVFPRLVAQQIALYARRKQVGAHSDAALQRKAIGGALKLLPSIAKRRYRGGISQRWTRFLRPAGSVPAIELPTTTAEATS